MSEWSYFCGDRLVCRVRRDDVPPIGWPVTYVAGGKPCENFRVVSVDEKAKTLQLETLP